MRWRLTAAGWPRPLTKGGLPIPWISPADNLGKKDHKRQKRVAGGWVCQVCGLRLPDADGYAYAFAAINWPLEDTGEPPNLTVGEPLPDDVGVHAMDHGLLHRRCARLALTFCPALKDLKADGVISICRVPPGSIEAFGAEAVVLSEDDLRPKEGVG